jgi:hypothetical protein
MRFPNQNFCVNLLLLPKALMACGELQIRVYGICYFEQLSPLNSEPECFATNPSRAFSPRSFFRSEGLTYIQMWPVLSLPPHFSGAFRTDCVRLVVVPSPANH